MGGEEKATLEEPMREQIRVTIESIVAEELESALGAAPSERVGPVRAGYRHGKRARTLTTSLGSDDNRDAAGENRGRRWASARVAQPR